MRKTRVKLLRTEASTFRDALLKEKGIELSMQESMKIVKRGYREEQKPISRKFKVGRKQRQRMRESSMVEMSVSTSIEKEEESEEGWDE